MAADPLVGYTAAMRLYLTDTLLDGTRTNKGVLGCMIRLDSLDSKRKRMKPVTRFKLLKDAPGPEAQWEYRLKLPAWQGISAQTGVLSTLQTAFQENFKTVGARQIFSHYDGVETIRKADIMALRKNPKSITDHVSNVSEAFLMGWWEKINTDLFPASNPAVSATYQVAENHLMSFHYPLQAPSGGVYEYGRLDLNSSGPPDYTQLKAVVSGDTTGSNAFGVVSMQRIRKQLIFPVEKRQGANVDLIVVDHDQLDLLLDEAEDKVVLNMGEKYDFAGEWYMINNRHVVAEARLDDLAAAGGQKREIWAGDTSVITFMFEPMDNSEVVPIAGAPSLLSMQGYCKSNFINLNPRYWGRGVDVRLS